MVPRLLGHAAPAVGESEAAGREYRAARHERPQRGVLRAGDPAAPAAEAELCLSARRGGVM